MSVAFVAVLAGSRGSIVRRGGELFKALCTQDSYIEINNMHLDNQITFHREKTLN